MSDLAGGGAAFGEELSAAYLCRLYELEEADLECIRDYGTLVQARLNELVAAFYGWLESQPEHGQFFSNTATLERVQRLMEGYWNDFLQAKVDDGYVGQRRMVGEVHARIGLPVETYLAAMNACLRLLTVDFYDGSLSADEYARSVRSLTKLLHLDTSVVVSAFNTRTQAIIAEQTESLMQMSTPVAEIWSGILMLPVVGVIDSKRASDMMNAMLSMIARTRSQTMILDISGVAVVDTAVANHLIKITLATKLMGCECTISGISPAIAQTMVELGIEVGEVNTTATLNDALAYAFRMNGIEIHRSS
jgi:rsbT co-antagonist protein RsbR